MSLNRFDHFLLLTSGYQIKTDRFTATIDKIQKNNCDWDITYCLTIKTEIAIDKVNKRIKLSPRGSASEWFSVFLHEVLEHVITHIAGFAHTREDELKMTKI